VLEISLPPASLVTRFPAVVPLTSFNPFLVSIAVKIKTIGVNRLRRQNKNSSGDEIANVNFFYNIAHVQASAYAH